MIYRLFTLLLPLTFLFACGNSAETSAQDTADAQAKYQDITVEEFADRIGGDNTVILDVRTPGETSKGIIEGAIELDYRAANFQEELQKLDPSKTYLVYCASGGRSGKACGMMQEAGFAEMYNLKGGYRSWSAKE